MSGEAETMIEQTQTTTVSGQTRPAIESRPPIGLLGSVPEVAATVGQLRFDPASSITVATIPVDGGLLAGGA